MAVTNFWMFESGHSWQGGEVDDGDGDDDDDDGDDDDDDDVDGEVGDNQGKIMIIDIIDKDEDDSVWKSKYTASAYIGTKYIWFAQNSAIIWSPNVFIIRP